MKYALSPEHGKLRGAELPPSRSAQNWLATYEYMEIVHPFPESCLPFKTLAKGNFKCKQASTIWVKFPSYTERQSKQSL